MDMSNILLHKSQTTSLVRRTAYHEYTTLKKFQLNFLRHTIEHIFAVIHDSIPITG